MTKSILVYGDSISWGFRADNMLRYPLAQRWPHILRGLLGKRAHVVEECLNGRTTAYDSPLLPDRNGVKALPPLLESHAPLDLVIIMLGTNDLQSNMHLTANDIAAGCGGLVLGILRSQAGPDLGIPKILVVAPPLVTRPVDAMAVFFDGVEENSRALPELYRRLAEGYKCDFLDASTIVEGCEIDGIHLTPESNAVLARAVADAVEPILWP
ncbi:MAG: SGNH/GDSL hydrolase family protein [Alphaproteobacteria bacterium]|nr:SGNH/GDSL hydrolase family protein [Alphaproteobacteria bacterium]